jgi:lipid-A-disaccharide synthase
MDKEVVKELIQNELNSKNLEIELHKIISGKTRETIQNDYEILEQKLGGKGASEKTANGIIPSIKN